METCKGCGISVQVKSGVLPADYSPDTGAYVSEQVYLRRVAVCEACQALQYGSTCRFCGSLVHYRACFRPKKRPHLSLSLGRDERQEGIPRIS